MKRVRAMTDFPPSGIKCPGCESRRVCVIDSRPEDKPIRVRRRRQCVDCLLMFTTVEAPENDLPTAQAAE